MNYCDISTVDVTDPEEVGMGGGSLPEGERICIALSGRQINLDLDPAWREHGWISMTVECARELQGLLNARLGPAVNRQSEP